MDFQLDKRPKLKVLIYGTAFELERPTVKQANDMKKKLKAAEGTEVEVFTEFLTGLGLPTELVDKMEMEHFVKLAEFMMSGKKN